VAADYQALVTAAKAETNPIDPSELERRLGDPPLLVDVREVDEYHAGALPGAVLVPRGVLERDAAGALPDTGAEVVLYCAGDARSALAARVLQEMGYISVRYLEGGFDAWRDAGRPWEVPAGLVDDGAVRYSRHLRLPEVGEKGQLRLRESRVALIGAGGLGSPAALYLAAAGVGTLGIVDHDRVDLSNLQRQILHDNSDVGRGKVESARETIAALNPDVRVVGVAERLAAGNALDVLAGYDVVVDGADNFPTRYLLNDASLHLGIPVVHGSVFRFEGQVTVFTPYAGPCYRCLFPEPPPPELAPNCADAGVLGVLPGVIGTLQATEAIKLLLGIGEPLVGRLLTYDALTAEFSTLRFGRNPACPACGDPEHRPRLVDYDASCRVPGI